MYKRDPRVAKVNLSNIVVIPSQVNAHPFKTPYYSFYFNYILRYIMAYGYSRFRKSSTGSVSRVGRGFSRIPKVAYRKKKGYYSMKFKGEKKYFDKTYQANNSETFTGNGAGSGVPRSNNGITYLSNTWGEYSFGSVIAPLTVSNCMLRGVVEGTNARSRIGNKIAVNYVKGAFTFNAALITSTASAAGQGGETYPSDGKQYLRTTYRMCIVKDLQVNSTDAQVTWNQVFDTSNMTAGVHSELNVNNMGRFIVLEDKIFTLDADTPQMTCPFMIKGSKIGSVRYNGTSGAFVTDKGLYVIYAAFVGGALVPASSDVELPSPVGHSRLCFTDV